MAAVFYTHLSPQVTHFWDLEGTFIAHTSLDSFFLTVNSSAWNLLLGLFGFVQLDAAGRLLVVLGSLVLSAVGVYRNQPMYGPALIVVGGFAASAAHVAPLGSGRADEYLYPAILLVLTRWRIPRCRAYRSPPEREPRGPSLSRRRPWSPWPRWFWPEHFSTMRTPTLPCIRLRT